VRKQNEAVVLIITNKITTDLMISVILGMYYQGTQHGSDRSLTYNSPGCRLGRTLTVQLLELGEGWHRLSKGGCRGTRQSDNKPHSTHPNRLHTVWSSISFYKCV